MPTYVYKNIENGELYEIRQSIRDEALSQHPETGAPIKRVPSQPGIAFRGSGFYVTDSRPKPAEAAKSGGADGGGTGGGGE